MPSNQLLVYYLLSFILLFVLMNVYLKIAIHYNIIDKPNERSSHTTLTIRGGGIIFSLAMLLYFLSNQFAYPFFIVGVLMMATVGFFDDVNPLSNKTRLFVHFTASLLLIYQSAIYQYSFLLIPFLLVFIVASLNSYNFMDGINGITAFYSLSILLLLYFLNNSIKFINPALLVFCGFSLIIFTFYNARKKAKCFAGDTGSLAIGFILFFITLSLIQQTGNPFYALFFTVYGLDTSITLIYRLIRKENIYKAHRTHLYQYLANEAGINHLKVSAAFAISQLCIGILIIYFTQFSFSNQIFSSSIILIAAALLYYAIRRYVFHRFVVKHVV